MFQYLIELAFGSMKKYLNYVGAYNTRALRKKRPRTREQLDEANAHAKKWYLAKNGGIDRYRFNRLMFHDLVRLEFGTMKAYQRYNHQIFVAEVRADPEKYAKKLSRARTLRRINPLTQQERDDFNKERREQRNNWSPEKKEAYRAKTRVSNLSEEERLIRVNRQRKRRANMTEEQKKRYNYDANERTYRYNYGKFAESAKQVHKLKKEVKQNEKQEE